MKLPDCLRAPSSRMRVFTIISAVVVALDQWSKYWAVANLTVAMRGAETFGERFARFWSTEHPASARPVEVLESFWRFRYAENPGAAWSFLAAAPDWFRAPFFLLVAAVAMVFIVVYFRRTEPDQYLVRLALAFIFGGAAGNFVDRARLGYVIDFVQWHWYNKVAWPTFNVADVGISIGVGLMVLDMILHRDTAKKNEPAPTGSRV